MKICFFGAGAWGKEALRCLEVTTDEYECIGFLDNFYSKNEIFGYPIITIDEVKKQDAVVVITIKSPRDMVDVYYQLKNELKDIYWFKGGKRRGDFLREKCISCADWGDAVLPGVEIHASDTCNLNCKGCTHFSPIFKDSNFNIIDKLHDIAVLKKKISKIVTFSILGGEPFLNPDLDLFISGVRELLPNSEIQVVTNGTFMLRCNPKVLQSIKDNNVILSISEYEPTHKLIEPIINLLEEYEIEYNVRFLENKQMFNKPLSLSGNSKYKQKCISSDCINIWNGKISRCPTLMYIERFNEVFGTNLPSEGIWSLEECPDGRELVELLKKPVPLCRHCVDNEMEWQRCDKTVQLSDFATID